MLCHICLDRSIFGTMLSGDTRSDICCSNLMVSTLYRRQYKKMCRANGTLHSIVMTILVQVFSKAAMASWRLRHIEVRMSMLYIHPGFDIFDKSLVIASQRFCHSFKLVCLSTFRSSIFNDLPSISLVSHILLRSGAIIYGGIITDIMLTASSEKLRNTLATLMGLSLNSVITILSYILWVNTCPHINAASNITYWLAYASCSWVPHLLWQISAYPIVMASFGRGRPNIPWYKIFHNIGPKMEPCGTPPVTTYLFVSSASYINGLPDEKLLLINNNYMGVLIRNFIVKFSHQKW